MFSEYIEVVANFDRYGNFSYGCQDVVKFNFDLVSYLKKVWDSKVSPVIISFSNYLSMEK